MNHNPEEIRSHFEALRAAAEDLHTPTWFDSEGEPTICREDAREGRCRCREVFRGADCPNLVRDMIFWERTETFLLGRTALAFAEDFGASARVLETITMPRPATFWAALVSADAARRPVKGARWCSRPWRHGAHTFWGACTFRGTLWPFGWFRYHCPGRD